MNGLVKATPTAYNQTESMCSSGKQLKLWHYGLWSCSLCWRELQRLWPSDSDGSFQRHDQIVQIIEEKGEVKGEKNRACIHPFRHLDFLLQRQPKQGVLDIPFPSNTVLLDNPGAFLGQMRYIMYFCGSSIFKKYFEVATHLIVSIHLDIWITERIKDNCGMKTILHYKDLELKHKYIS